MDDAKFYSSPRQDRKQEPFMCFQDTPSQCGASDKAALYVAGSARPIISAGEWIFDRRLKYRHIMVLNALFMHANKEGRCWPKKETLARITGIATNKLAVTTKELEDLGWLTKTGNGGRSRAATYEIIIPESARKSMNDALNKSQNGTSLNQENQSQFGTNQDNQSQNGTRFDQANHENQSQKSTGIPHENQSQNGTKHENQSQFGIETSPNLGLRIELASELNNISTTTSTKEEEVDAVCRETKSSPESTSQTDAGQPEAQPKEPSQPKPKRASSAKRRIADDWQPSKRCIELATQQGIPAEFCQGLVGEFVMYWAERGDARPSWDATFLNHAKRQWAYSATAQKEAPTGTANSDRGVSGNNATDTRGQQYAKPQSQYQGSRKHQLIPSFRNYTSEQYRNGANLNGGDDWIPSEP